MKHVLIALLIATAALNIAHAKSFKGSTARPSNAQETFQCIEAGLENGDSKADIAWSCNVDIEDIADYE